MRIAFVTTCLQPARDGVGDYTACLAAECAARGHETLKLALNDPFANPLQDEGATLRLGAALPWGDRWKIAAETLRKFAPDFISLQFVCYGFHPRGLCFGLGAKLRNAFGDAPVQIMAHELWIGAEIGASKKDRLVGAIQRKGVLSTIKHLRPAVVHTTNPAYRGLLEQNGIACRRLRLFGAIPTDRPDRSDPTDLKSTWRFALFGALHPVWPPSPLLDQLAATGKKIEITHIGNIGRGQELWERIRAGYGDRIAFERKGELAPEEVAEIFSQMDFGIATTPWELIGKSGSVAAMLDHGLPVVVNRDDVHFRRWREQEEKDGSPLLIKMGTDLGQQLTNAVRQAPRSNRAEVATQFLNDLKGAL